MFASSNCLKAAQQQQNEITINKIVIKWYRDMDHSPQCIRHVIPNKDKCRLQAVPKTSSIYCYIFSIHRALAHLQYIRCSSSMFSVQQKCYILSVLSIMITDSELLMLNIKEIKLKQRNSEPFELTI